MSHAEKTLIRIKASGRSLPELIKSLEATVAAEKRSATAPPPPVQKGPGILETILCGILGTAAAASVGLGISDERGETITEPSTRKYDYGDCNDRYDNCDYSSDDYFADPDD